VKTGHFFYLFFPTLKKLVLNTNTFSEISSLYDKIIGYHILSIVIGIVNI